MAARLKNMTILHNGKEIARHVYFGSETAFVLISRIGYEVQRIAPGKWKTVRALTDIEFNILIEQSEADKWTAFQQTHGLGA